MRPTTKRFLFAAFVLTLLPAGAGRLTAQQESNGQVVSVAKTFDSAPFQYTERLLAEREGIRVYRLTYPSPVVTEHEANNTVSADLYLPSDLKPGDPKRPAVICLHPLDGNMQITDYACSRLALRGIPAIVFSMPYYGPREIDGGWRALLHSPNLFLASFRQTIEDIHRTVDLLASRPEIDGQHIDMIGLSLGGIIAASAAAKEPRIDRTVILVAGGDVMEIVRQSRYTRSLAAELAKMPEAELAEFRTRVETIEPLRLAPELRDRAQAGKVLMLNATEDGIIPHECTVRLAESLGITDQVQWLDGVDHESFLGVLPEIAPTIIEFFAQDLPPGVEPYQASQPVASTPQQKFIHVLRQAIAIWKEEPKPEHCHRMEVDVVVRREQDEKPADFHLRMVRGDAYQFAVECTAGAFGKIRVGQGEYPWIELPGGRVLAGTQNAVNNRDPLQFVNQQHLAKVRVAAALLDGLTSVPDALKSWVAIEDNPLPDGSHALQATAVSNHPVALTVVLRGNESTPKQIRFKIFGYSGTIDVTNWQIGGSAEPSAFEPPMESERFSLDQADVYHLFSAAVNLAVNQMR